MLCERTGAIAHFSKYLECVGGQLAEHWAIDVCMPLTSDFTFMAQTDRHADDQFPDGYFLSRLTNRHTERWKWIDGTLVYSHFTSCRTRHFIHCADAHRVCACLVNWNTWKSLFFVFCRIRFDCLHASFKKVRPLLKCDPNCSVSWTAVTIRRQQRRRHWRSTDTEHEEKKRRERKKGECEKTTFLRSTESSFAGQEFVFLIVCYTFVFLSFHSVCLAYHENWAAILPRSFTYIYLNYKFNRLKEAELIAFPEQQQQICSSCSHLISIQYTRNSHTISFTSILRWYARQYTKLCVVKTECAQTVWSFGTQLFDQFQPLVKLSSFFHHIQSSLSLFSFLYFIYFACLIMLFMGKSKNKTSKN